MSLLATRPLQAASAQVNRSLVGLTAVRIVVEDLNRDMQATGLRKEQLYTLAAQQLGKDGFTVVGPQDQTRVPLVYIRLSAVSGGATQDMPVSFYLNVQVKQLATLTQGMSGTCQAAATPETSPLLVTTWERGSMAIVNHAELFFGSSRNRVGDFRSC